MRIYTDFGYRLCIKKPWHGNTLFNRCDISLLAPPKFMGQVPSRLAMCKVCTFVIYQHKFLEVLSQSPSCAFRSFRRNLWELPHLERSESMQHSRYSCKLRSRQVDTTPVWMPPLPKWWHWQESRDMTKVIMSFGWTRWPKKDNSPTRWGFDLTNASQLRVAWYFLCILSRNLA